MQFKTKIIIVKSNVKSFIGDLINLYFMKHEWELFLLSNFKYNKKNRKTIVNDPFTVN